MKRINVFFVFLLMALMFLSACGNSAEIKLQSQNLSQDLPKGRLILTITDDAVDMGSISKVDLTINSIRAHSATKGWFDISTTPKTYDLLQLKKDSKDKILADVQTEEDMYDQIRIEISKVTITDSNGKSEAKLPSNVLKIDINLTVRQGFAAAAKLDFSADDSLHIAINKRYVMAPVIRIKTQENADALIKNDGQVEIKGGKITSEHVVGMDEKGNMVLGVAISKDAILDLDLGGKISITKQEDETEIVKGSGRIIFAAKDKEADMSSIIGIKMTINDIKVQSPGYGWITLSSEPKTFDLLELKSEGSAILLSNSQIEKGVYTQIRLNISNVTVVDSNGNNEAKLPSGELKIIGNLFVNENSTSTALFDFSADDSLHQNGNGDYIFAPVIKLEIREKANVKIKSGFADIEGGIIKTSTTLGMDAKGNIGVGLKIPKNVDIALG